MKLLSFLFAILLCLKPALGKTTTASFVYGISPRFFSSDDKISAFKAISMRLPELQELGINIIWLQPITPPFEEDGHGYDVIDYKKVWSVLGSDQDFKALVQKAHKMNMKVMLDMVINHSSFEHPFVKDIIKNGKQSPYYDFYQQTPLADVPYAQHFHTKTLGNGDFIYYFWEHLLNFNYQNEKLRNYLFETLEFWVKDFEVDGFRFDASWGPSSRWPQFYKSVSQRLRKLNPNIILMAEDMAGYPVHYKGTNHPHLAGSGFDWAYDWNNSDPHWISRWSYQVSESQDESVFNLKDPEAATDAFLVSVKYGQGQEKIKTVRYIENNDTPGFLRSHTYDEMRWASKIMFMLPGIPLIFYGQEKGNRHNLFELPSFDPKESMKKLNPGVWTFYQSLIALRKGSAALSDGSMSKIKRINKTKISFFRIFNDEKKEVVLDFKAKKLFLDGRELTF